MDDVVQSDKTGDEKGAEYRETMISFFNLKSTDTPVLNDSAPMSSQPTGSSFDVVSNLRMIKYGRQPADIMFQVGHFKYEFYDSEQVARQFIYQSARNESLKGTPTEKDKFDQELQRLKAIDQQIQSLEFLGIDRQTALRAELRNQLKSYEDEKVDFGELFPDIDSTFTPETTSEEKCNVMQGRVIEKLLSLRKIQIQIASHGDMCHSCQGTYWYELEASHNLERNIFRAITLKASKTIKKVRDDVAAAPQQIASSDKKSKQKGSPSPTNRIDALLTKLGNVKASEDPRTQFFPECSVSVLVSSTRTKPKESRARVPLSALLTETTRSPGIETWWKQ